MRQMVLAILAVPVCLAASPSAQAGAPAPPGKVSFSKQVLPLLRERCFSCHQGRSPRGRFRLDRKDEILGLTTGRTLAEPGHSEKSLLVLLVSGRIKDRVMPPRGERLAAAEVELLRGWIDQGLSWDEKALPTDEAPAHWAFAPVSSPEPPRVGNGGWVRNPIDAFVAARHEREGLRPAPEASRRVLLRRVSLDLLGLPPAPEEVEAFVNDPRPDAYERAVDRLLASPHHGERWARHWLDLARWAESEGYESNHLRPFAWRYRDWVAQAFNDDMPYASFLRAQLAGDEIVPYRDENLVATGFLAAARLSSNEEDKPRQRTDVLVDIVNATSSVFLGVTLHCAQCHNHKLDPFTTRDYYRLLGFFTRGQPGNFELRDPAMWQRFRRAVPAGYEEARRTREEIFEKARNRLIEEARQRIPAEMLQALAVPGHLRSDEQERLARQAELKFQYTPGRIEKAIPEADRPRYNAAKSLVEKVEKQDPRPQTFAYVSPATSPHRIEHLPMVGFYPLPYDVEEMRYRRSHILIGGDVHRRGPAVSPGWPEILGPTPEPVASRGSRLELAAWLTDPKHPLTWRVYVNRIWHWHFGRGLVATPSDLGTKGGTPSHPDLLDWLTQQLLRNGQSTKHLHRLIVTSATYRQSAAGDEASTLRDPDNVLLTRWKPRRLEAEVIRDTALAVSGLLDPRLGGPGIEDEPTLVRRSLYVQQRRDLPPMWQGLFDGPTGVTESCPGRAVTTVPLQSLYLLNSEAAVFHARALARRLRAEGGSSRNAQVELAFRHVLGRPPTREERENVRKFLGSQPLAAIGSNPDRQLLLLCQTLLSLNELAYLE